MLMIRLMTVLKVAFLPSGVPITEIHSESVFQKARKLWIIVFRKSKCLNLKKR
jgi:hypothetical protein